PGSGGTVFELKPPAYPGAPWAENVLLHVCAGIGTSGPESSVAIGAGGVLYEATSDGTVFSLSPPSSAGGSWTAAVLYTGLESPSGNAAGTNVALLGTTHGGGSHACPP